MKPGLPAVFAFEPATIETVQLPTPAWYPGSRPAIRATLLAEHRAAVNAAESELAAATADGTTKSTGVAKEAVAADGREVDVALGHVDLLRARLAAAEAALASVEARLAADRSRLDGSSDEARVERLSRRAIETERRATVLSAEAAWRDQRYQRAVTQADTECDAAKRDKAIAAIDKELAAAQSDLQKARDHLMFHDADATYTRFSPSYPKSSTGRRRALAPGSLTEIIHSRLASQSTIFGCATFMLRWCQPFLTLGVTVDRRRTLSCWTRCRLT